MRPRAKRLRVHRHGQWPRYLTQERVGQAPMPSLHYAMLRPVSRPLLFLARHPAIVRAALRLHSLVGAGLLSEGDATDVIHRAAAHAGKDDQKEIDRIIEWARTRASSRIPEGIRS